MERFRLISFFLIGIAFFPLRLESDGIEDLLLIDDGLRSIGMSREDLALRIDYLPIDPFRLKIVNQLMESPLDAIPLTLEMGEKISSGRDSLNALLRMSIEVLDFPVGAGLILNPGLSPGHGLIQDAPTLKKKRSDTPLRDAIAILSDSENMEGIPALPLPLQKSIAELLYAIHDAEAFRKKAFRRLSDEEIEFLRSNARRPIFEEEEEEVDSYNISRRVLEIAGKVDFQKLFQGGFVLTKAIEEALPQLVDINPPEADSPEWSFREDTPLGPVILSGAGNDIHRGHHLLLIDFGGNDVYQDGGNRNPANPALPITQPSTGQDERVSVTIDLGGNDVYSHSTDFEQGGGFLGYSFLLDQKGNDLYSAKSFSQGCGFFGVGVLVDGGGEDTYKGEVGVQGSGFFGVGIFSDRSGGDAYDSQFFSQGFGYVKGCGILADYEGNDQYVIGGRFPDHREPDYFACLGQGFGFGTRDFASGGVGILFDEKGNDSYIGEYFVQGSSYWFALGCLIDEEGNDKYIARRYSQGAATHLTIGVLLDRAGNDDYLSWGVSQGCGHDLSLGLLYDQEGNDKYSSDWLSQGAGNANGIGILLDDRGNDQYSARKKNNQGYGNRDRDYGSIGLLLDQGGKDIYTLQNDSLNQGRDNHHWTKSYYGAGIDREKEE
jgi:hypothetical protein